MLTAALEPPTGPADSRTWPSRAERARLFAGLEETPLLLAVSGGPDSMALMRLVAGWAHDLAAVPPTIHVACVDHGLRAQSAEEARMVAAAAADLDLPCATLPWRGPKPATRRQERARAARYALLAEHARAVGATHVLTAHHADDQAETVLMRLLRGSGVTGLAGMARETPLGSDLTLMRPLLDVPKEALVAFCRREGQDVVDDPSNRDPAYARARLRAEAASLARLGLDRDALVRLSRRMARAEAALEAQAQHVEAALGPTRAPGAYRLDLSRTGDIEAEIFLRVLRRAVGAIAAPGRLVRLARLEALADALTTARGAGAAHHATLAGTRIVLAADGTLSVTPEAPRRRGRPPI